MCHGYGRGQEKHYGQAAENALGHYRAQCSDSQHSHPLSFFGDPGPESQDQSQKSDKGRSETMAVLVEDPSHPLGNREREHIPSVGGWPVGNGQAGFSTGDKPADKY